MIYRSWVLRKMFWFSPNFGHIRVWLLVASISVQDIQPAMSLSAPLPNFVFMMADDMGYGDWSRTGGMADTPELEKMSSAQGAVWFQRGYAGNPICSPTRVPRIQPCTIPIRYCNSAQKNRAFESNVLHG